MLYLCCNEDWILYRLDISDCLFPLVILMSGFLGEVLNSYSFFIAFVIESPLIILGDAMVLTGEELYILLHLR